jgi:uncharacterized membrane protein YphA (DoxX/SURF4 family)
MDFEKIKEYAPVINRIGLSLVFLWFGISQLVNPLNFIGYLPDWAPSMMDRMMGSNTGGMMSMMTGIASPNAILLIRLNGVFELILGTMLILGFFTRIAALLLAAHLFFITIELGYGDVAVRDIGLTISTIAVAIWGEDKWCLQKKKQN